MVGLGGLDPPEGTARSLVARYRTGGNRFLRGCGMLFPFGSRTLLFLGMDMGVRDDRTYYGVDLRSISAAEIIELVRRWQECVIRLDEMLYEDARKEFSLTSMMVSVWMVPTRKSNRISRVFEVIS